MATNLLGIKYPASRIMGGNMNRKKTSGVNVDGGCSDVKNNKNPEIRLSFEIICYEIKQE